MTPPAKGVRSRQQRDGRSRDNPGVLDCGFTGTFNALLQQIENPRARNARILAHKNGSIEPFCDGLADRHDRRCIQGKLPCTRANSIRAE